MGATILIVAQEGTDQTGRQITTLIVALLVIALLLALLTGWYWRHTDPRRRAHAKAAKQSVDLVAEEERRAAADEPAPRERPDIAAFVEQSSTEWADEVESDDGISADDWLRLTGPQAIRRTNPK